MSAIDWLDSQGYTVYVPLQHSPDVDLIATRGAETIRIEVKTTTVRRGDRWEATICTRGGNQSWNGVTKRFDGARCEYLFILVGDGRRWMIPAAEVGGSKVMLGGPKFAAYEVDRGRPILAAAGG